MGDPQIPKRHNLFFCPPTTEVLETPTPEETYCGAVRLSSLLFFGRPSGWSVSESVCREIIIIIILRGEILI